MTSAVIGREHERAAMESFLAAIADGPQALVLSGEPGIGKTMLWEEGVGEARRLSRLVLPHRSVEAENSLSFTALSDLLAPVWDDVATSLAPLRRRALEVALLLAEPGAEAPNPRAIGLALLDVLRVVAERNPVLLALDDLQWLDASSANALQIALRRLGDEPVRLLATVRRAPEVASSLDLETAFPEDRLSRLALGPLSLGALHRVLKERAGLELTRPELARVREASAGNPFFALELGRELVRTNVRPEAGRALRVPESLHELLDGRLARLPTETGDVVLFAAALARPTVELVATAHGDRADVLEALDAAEREGVVSLDDSKVRFAHPLLASICYEQAKPWKRRAVHAALARTVTDLEEQARHMALSVEGPDAEAASQLDAAAEQAAARGATAAAAELSELAARLTPDDRALAHRRLIRSASLYRLAGERTRAVTMLDALLGEVAGVERADVLLELARTHRADQPATIALLDDALAEARADDVRSARILAYRALYHMLGADIEPAISDSRAAMDKAERAGDAALLAVTIARTTQLEMYASEVTPGLLERGVEIEDRLGLSLEYVESPRVYLARLLMRRGELDRAREMCAELETNAAARGDEETRILILWQLAGLEWLAGRWSSALEHAFAARDLGEQTQFFHRLGWGGRLEAYLEADLGLVDEARATAEAGNTFATTYSQEFFGIASLGALGRLELALGNLVAAGEYLRALPGRLVVGGLDDPTAPVWADTIETLVGLGELESACEWLELYEQNAERLGSPQAKVGAARCRGLVVAARGDLSAAEAAFERSLADAGSFPLERGRTLLCLGTVRRQAQQKRAAREALEQALGIFEELGARLWAEKARAELRRISGRAPASGELTETERRVAELAARGRTNREIATELFMGVSTVEAHLSRVYRKLGVRRTELATHLAVRPDETVHS
jgi:DNA-binding CsgD family transcriptional regulator